MVQSQGTSLERVPLTSKEKELYSGLTRRLAATPTKSQPWLFKTSETEAEISLETKTKQNKTKRNETKRNETKQNKTKQNKTKQTTNGYGPQKDLINTLDRRTQTTIFRLSTGHCGHRKHLRRLCLADWAYCECGSEERTTEHILQTCPHLETVHQQFWPEDTEVGTKLWGTSCQTTADGGLPSSHRPEDLARSSHRPQKKKNNLDPDNGSRSWWHVQHHGIPIEVTQR